MKSELPKLLIFASGTATDGGSGFENLVKSAKDGILKANIVGVVSNHQGGGIYQRAKKLGIPFLYFPKPYEADKYQEIVRSFKADFVALSGWLKKVEGLDPRTTFNIHPGPLPRFGGDGWYGDKVHQGVLEAYKQGELTHSAVSMHFVTPNYDEGPVFFSFPVKIEPEDTLDTLKHRVNAEEHRLQPIITDMVVNGKIRWDGKDPKSLLIEPFTLPSSGE